MLVIGFGRKEKRIEGEIEMSLKCEQGIEYGCPYFKECESNRPLDLNIANPQNPHLIYSRAKGWSNTTLTWADKDNLYSCHPENLIRKRNIEIISRETFYEKDAKQIRKKVLEEVQETISGLKER